MRKLLWTAFVLLFFGHCAITWGQCPPTNVIYQSRRLPLIVERDANRFGLTRTWFNQLNVSQKTDTIEHVLLHDGTLFIVSGDCRLHALDAETGTTLWTKTLGTPGSIALAPAANSRMVAVVGGITLYVFDRKTGRCVWEAPVSGVPGVGCALSEKFVYLPLSNGRILAWPLEDEEVLEYRTNGVRKDGATEEQDGALSRFREEPNEVIENIRFALDSARKALYMQEEVKKEKSIVLKPPKFIPLECQSFGLCLALPTVCTMNTIDEYLVWATDRGDMYVGGVGESFRGLFLMLYQVRLSAQSYSFGRNGIQTDWIQHREIIFQPTYCPKIALDEEGKLDEDSDFIRIARPTERGNYTSYAPFVLDSAEESTATVEQINENHLPGMVLIGNAAGYVAAINETSGSVIWKYIASTPISSRVVAIKNRVYFCTLLGGMHALDKRTGREIWFAPEIYRFLAESEENIYAIDFRRELVILDKETGEVRTGFSAIPYGHFFENMDSDRIYLLSPTGLVQCLRETDREIPLKHQPTAQDIVARIRKSLEDVPERKSAPSSPDSPTLPGFEQENPESEGESGFEGEEEGFFEENEEENDDEFGGFGDDDFGDF